MNYKVYTYFVTLNPWSLKDIQGEHLHNFKEIFLMMYVYHKGFLLPHMMPDKCALTLQTS